MPTTQYWRLPSRTIRIALRSDALLFYQRDVQPLLCISDPAVPGMVKQQCNMQQSISIRQAQRAFSLKEWMNAKRNEKNKANICNFQNFFLSLPCQNFNRGTSAASSRWLFLYPLISVNDTAAPRRECGNAPGSPAIETLTTRSAASLCQNSIVMATLTINRAARRTLTIREWLGRKNEHFSTLCGEEFTNQHVLLAQLYCIALIALCCVAEWLEGGTL